MMTDMSLINSGLEPVKAQRKFRDHAAQQLQAKAQVLHEGYLAAPTHNKTEMSAQFH
jgi:hypothetical protein